MNRCCAKCKTPFNCGNRACNCHRTTLLATLIARRLSESSVNNTEPTVSSEPAPANVTPLFQEPK